MLKSKLSTCGLVASELEMNFENWFLAWQTLYSRKCDGTSEWLIHLALSASDKTDVVTQASSNLSTIPTLIFPILKSPLVRFLETCT